MLELKAMWEPAWKRNSRGTDPQKVAEEIYGISDEPTAEQIVEMARDESTESNKLFDWDDSVAGPKWRKEQARLICRMLKVEFIPSSNKPVEETKMIPCRLFYGNPTKNESFMPITVIMNNQDTYNKLLQRAVMELKSFQKKYAMLKELEAVFDVIDRIYPEHITE